MVHPREDTWHTTPLRDIGVNMVHLNIFFGSMCPSPPNLTRKRLRYITAPMRLNKTNLFLTTYLVDNLIVIDEYVVKKKK